MSYAGSALGGGGWAGGDGGADWSNTSPGLDPNANMSMDPKLYNSFNPPPNMSANPSLANAGWNSGVGLLTTGAGGGDGGTETPGAGENGNPAINGLGVPTTPTWGSVFDNMSSGNFRDGLSGAGTCDAPLQ